MEREATQGQPIRVVYFGSPEFAVPTLEALSADSRFEVTLLVTSLDKAAGRGRGTSVPSVKEFAARTELPVFQPTSVNQPETRALLSATNADLFVVAAYGVIFGSKTLRLPRLPSVNLHASLLPAFRGANPIAAAILSGVTRTGVSLMVMEADLDTGPVLASSDLPIDSMDTTETLTAKLAMLGAKLVPDALVEYALGKTIPRPQLGDPTMTRPLTKLDGWIDWGQPAQYLERFVRAMWPWPRAWTSIGVRDPPSLLQLHRATAQPNWSPSNVYGGPGTFAVKEGRPMVVCGDGMLEIEIGQVSGGRPLSGAELVRGRRLVNGEVLGQFGAPPPQPAFWRPVEG
ncbi:MAG: methionyl-tRNA formyltransferase [Chloroflexota bacterium]|nr:methionyl-tRNA formyltransferase [Chloroflexota bacterium]